MQINPEVVQGLTIYIVNSSNPKINLGAIKTSSICEQNVQKNLKIVSLIYQMNKKKR